MPFIDWLHKSCEDYVVTGEPHARVILNSDTNGNKALSEPSISHRYYDDHTSFNIIWPNSGDPDDMYRSMLRLFLQFSPVTNREADLWIHASGIVHDKKAYLFTGPSGAGKTTICDILSKKNHFSILQVFHIC